MDHQRRSARDRCVLAAKGHAAPQEEAPQALQPRGPTWVQARGVRERPGGRNRHLDDRPRAPRPLFLAFAAIGVAAVLRTALRCFSSASIRSSRVVRLSAIVGSRLRPPGSGARWLRREARSRGRSQTPTSSGMAARAARPVDCRPSKGQPPRPLTSPHSRPSRHASGIAVTSQATWMSPWRVSQSHPSPR